VLAGTQARAADDKIYKIGGGVTAPKVLSKVAPEYPSKARDRKISGFVVLSVVAGTDGIAHDINVLKGINSGVDEGIDSAIDGKAVEAVQQWRFQPGAKDGEPVQVRATVEINFRPN
jgi:TonB family protein